jgi:twitching motility two-component system response regulator PilG
MARKRVLIVDDSPTIRRIVEMTLQRAGYEVLTADTGIAALAAVVDHRPDLILLDVMLPSMNGYHVCQLIKRNQRARDIPVVMLTGKDGVFDKVRGRLVGAAAYMTKPFTPGALLAVVEKHAGPATAPQGAEACSERGAGAHAARPTELTPTLRPAHGEG